MVRANRFVVTMAICVAGCSHLFAQQNAGQTPARVERQSEWNGFSQAHFKVADRSAYVVAPNESAAGNPWIWRARFPGYHAEMDIELLKQGFHVAYVDVAAMFGSPKAVEIGNAFYDIVTAEWKLADKPALEGVSRGGLFVYNWAAKNPGKVACIYCDTPVCDFNSWPAGQGTGIGSDDAWKQCLNAYGITADAAETYRQTPIGQAKLIADAAIPILHIVSENDRVVPPKENTYRLKSALQEFGHSMGTIVVPEGTAKSNGHHFDHPDPERVIRFISRHASAHRKPEHLLKNARRIVFLGDSITYAGHYVTYFSSWLEEQATPSRPVVINVGLPSETVSGLSEDGHAGGRFPRPHLDERLERVLRETKPDLVIACYGINCGIYQPFDPQRLRAYKQGLIGLRNAVQNAEADIVFVTPPTFDDQKSNKPFSYDDVMDKYAKHLLNAGHGSTENWSVIDLHGPMKQELLRRRASDPEFTFQPDAVHPNKSGHWFIAQQLIGSFGGDKEFADTPEQEFDAGRLQLVEKRMTLLRDAYLSAAGHKRPGIRKGMPLRAAKAAAAEITQQLRGATSPAAN